MYTYRCSSIQSLLLCVVITASVFPGLPSDTNVVTPNTECSWDFTTKTRSTNDDGTSLDLEWEDEEGESYIFCSNWKVFFLVSNVFKNYWSLKHFLTSWSYCDWISIQPGEQASSSSKLGILLFVRQDWLFFLLRLQQICWGRADHLYAGHTVYIHKHT